MKYQNQKKFTDWISRLQETGQIFMNNKAVFFSGIFNRQIKILIDTIYFQTTLLFDATILEFIPPCGLHLILAHHRYMWKFLHSIITKRSQEELFPVALRKIGCTYLAFQLDSYFKRYLFFHFS